jgi:hypothetical protein
MLATTNPPERVFLERMKGLEPSIFCRPSNRTFLGEKPDFRAFLDGPCRDRTYDLGIKSPLLYQLS